MQENADNTPWPKPVYSWYVVAVLMLAYTSSFVDRQILSLLIEPIRRDLNVSDTQISLLAGLAFTVFYTVMGIPIARLSDQKNRKIIVTAGIAALSRCGAQGPGCKSAGRHPDRFRGGHRRSGGRK